MYINVTTGQIQRDYFDTQTSNQRLLRSPTNLIWNTNWESRLAYTSAHTHRNSLSQTLLKKCMFQRFSGTFVWNIFHSKKQWERCDKKCTFVFTLSTRYSCQILMKLSQQVFAKQSNAKFRENPSSGNPVVLRGRTNGQTWRS